MDEQLVQAPQIQGASIHHCRKDCLFSSVNQQEAPAVSLGKSPYGVTPQAWKMARGNYKDQGVQSGSPATEMEDGRE